MLPTAKGARVSRGLRAGGNARGLLGKSYRTVRVRPEQDVLELRLLLVGLLDRLRRLLLRRHRHVLIVVPLRARNKKSRFRSPPTAVSFRTQQRERRPLRFRSIQRVSIGTRSAREREDARVEEGSHRTRAVDISNLFAYTPVCSETNVFFPEPGIQRNPGVKLQLRHQRLNGSRLPCIYTGM